jgi:hypothetical protein
MSLFSSNLLAMKVQRPLTLLSLMRKVTMFLHVVFQPQDLGRYHYGT